MKHFILYIRLRKADVKLVVLVYFEIAHFFKFCRNCQVRFGTYESLFDERFESLPKAKKFCELFCGKIFNVPNHF